MAIAKMSPGIVRFYFDSKAAMLVASLQFLAAEFEEQVLLPVRKLEVESGRGARADGGSVPRSGYRQPAQSLRLVRLLGRSQLAAGILRHLRKEGRELRGAGARADRALDRGHRAAAARCRRRSRSVSSACWRCCGRTSRSAPRTTSIGRRRDAAPWPTCVRCFPVDLQSRPRPRASPAAAAGLAAWVYADPRAAVLERESLFRRAWQIVAHASQIPRAGDFLTADLGAERILLVRDASACCMRCETAVPRCRTPWWRRAAATSGAR